ncbi:TlpA family protein disulfide reductase [Sphingobacterium yanglingense]|uniref:Thiol-disulfide isomerase/thioredoxin n=1 Tax=Sphingobacterium yanglingense TaxID=1437280 RepID=A0A4R6WNY6_9SPHI|nr:TlpA disulfide reductase family protein [Sphingobacterium yanglingense]TDQ77935.1 thiol-disulfide isomerase/thioredoxin [Sphingobacterium yanglingense]
MKKTVLFIAFILCAISLQAQVKEYTITSSIKGIEGEEYDLTIWDGANNGRWAKGKVSNGQIYYRDTTSVPLMIRIFLKNKGLYKSVGRGSIPVKSQGIWLVVMPGEKVQLKGHLSDFAEVYPQGGKENKVLSELTKAYHPLLNKAVNIELHLALNEGKVTAAEEAKLRQGQENLNSAAQKVMDTFLEKYASSIAGLYYIEDMLLRENISVEFAEKLLPSVTAKYRNTSFYKKVANRVEGNKYTVGKTIFTISSNNTYDGKAFTADSWKGKFYLIDFWGSWCGPCMADVPDLKKLRDAYPDKLQVLGIASDKDTPWRKAVVEHDLNWTQILNGAGEQDFVSRLNVAGFPTKILVDPNGEIVYRSTGGGETSFQKMAEIIENWKK